MSLWCSGLTPAIKDGLKNKRQSKAHSVTGSRFNNKHITDQWLDHDGQYPDCDNQYPDRDDQCPDHKDHCLGHHDQWPDQTGHQHHLIPITAYQHFTEWLVMTMADDQDQNNSLESNRNTFSLPKLYVL